MKIINKRDSEKFIKSINVNLNVDNYVFIEDDKRYYIVSRDVSKIDFSKLNIRKMGLYFGEYEENKFILSREARDLFC